MHNNFGNFWGNYRNERVNNQPESKKALVRSAESNKLTAAPAFWGGWKPEQIDSTSSNFLQINTLLKKKNEVSYPLPPTKSNTDEIFTYEKIPYPFQIIIQTTDTIRDVADTIRVRFPFAVVKNSEEVKQLILQDTPESYALYIFLYIGEMEVLPLHSPFCVYNLEQAPYWTTTFPFCHHDPVVRSRIEIGMLHCGLILDYSEHNIDHYPPHLKNKVLFSPIPIHPHDTIPDIDSQTKVVFFGTPSPRRIAIITRLKQQYGLDVHIVNTTKIVTGDALYNELRFAKVILNIHLKPQSILETARINTCLRDCQAIIVSEDSIDKDMQKLYENVVTFVPTVKDDLSNFDKLGRAILLALITPLDELKRRNTHIQNIIKQLACKDQALPLFNKPYLFHKFFLGISAPHDPITYEIVQNGPLGSKDCSMESADSVAHLHCYDITKFHEIYDDYLPVIREQFNIIVTYSEGNFEEVYLPTMSCLKIPNRGLDIGAKFCVVKYLIDHDIPYDRILFLHSKSDPVRRKQYFDSLIDGLCPGHLRKFNNQLWETKGDRMRSLTGQYNGNWLPERNVICRDELAKYLTGEPIGDSTFSEGNVYLLERSKSVQLFGNRIVYNVLNRQSDFDYNWVSKRYGIEGSISYVFKRFNHDSLKSRDEFSFDGYIEHAFERIIKCVPLHGMKVMRSMISTQLAQRIGVIITTHGFAGIWARQCIQSYIRELPKDVYIVLYVNESEDPITLNLGEEFPEIEYIYVEDQVAGGGLTGTWNRGINKCFEKGRDIVILSNDDILFDSSIGNIVECAAASQDSSEELKYFGPLTNNLTYESSCSSDYAVNNIIHGKQNWRNTKTSSTPMTTDENLNGFFMVCTKRTLLANKFDDTHYFDPAFPFGGNEVEWHNRLVAKQGTGIIVPNTFICHYKLASWRENTEPRSTCVYTVNTGGYEGTSIRASTCTSLPYDVFYFTDDIQQIYACLAQGVIPMYVSTKGQDAKLVQRTIKTSPHLYLPHKYDRSIYIDGNVYLNNNNEGKLFSLMKNRRDIICFSHPGRQVVSDECDVVIEEQLETRANVNSIKNLWREANFQDDVGLTETNVLVRNHKDIIKFSEDWTKCIVMCKRDQVSFDFMRWKHKINCSILPFKTKTDIFSKKMHENPLRRTVKDNLE